MTDLDYEECRCLFSQVLRELLVLILRGMNDGGNQESRAAVSEKQTVGHPRERCPACVKRTLRLPYRPTDGTDSGFVRCFFYDRDERLQDDR